MGEQKYEINKTVLKEFYEELMALEDWIPFEIKSSLPLEISMKLGSKVKNKDRQDIRSSTKGKDSTVPKYGSSKS